MSKRPNVTIQFALPIRDLYIDVLAASHKSEVSNSGWYTSLNGVEYFLNRSFPIIDASFGMQFLMYVFAENAVEMFSAFHSSGRSTTSPPR